MCSHLQNPVSEWKISNIFLCCSKGQIKDQKGLFCSYQPLFQDQVLQRSVRIHRSHLTCHTRDCRQRETGVSRGTQGQGQDTESPAPQTHSHSNTPMLLQGLYVSQQNKAVKTMFLLIWQADPQHSQTATPASYMKNVAPNLPEG